eukprot:1398471-Prymnesium_polylepis.1
MANWPAWAFSLPSPASSRIPSSAMGVHGSARPYAATAASTSLRTKRARCASGALRPSSEIRLSTDGLASSSTIPMRLR